MAKTFWDIIVQTIEKVGTPLSPKEIWEKANEIGTLGDYVTNGKTPWATIAALLSYTDIQRAGDNSTITQTSERPAQFFLRKLESKTNVDKLQRQKDAEITKKEIAELREIS